MGSILKYERPRPLIRQPQANAAAEQEVRETRRSLLILTSSFFVTAVVMCVAVVAAVSSTWTDVVIMSMFVLVFALLKIGLANALIFTMLRYDAASANVAPSSNAARSYRRVTPNRPAQTIKGKGTRSAKPGKLRRITPLPAE